MAGACRGDHGGILGLLDLIEEHRPAFEYDWRARFSCPLSEVGEGMTYGEALRLTTVLASDPASRVAASMAGWDRPASTTELALLDLYDAFMKVHFKKPKPYPRPWPSTTKSRLKPTVSQQAVLEALRFAGHTMPIPT